MKSRVALGLLLVLALSAACSTTPEAAEVPTTAPEAAPTEAAVALPTTMPAAPQAPALPEGWQSYTNPAGFAIGYPASWTLEEAPAETGATFSTASVKGAEGDVVLHWGVGFGGACPQGYSSVALAEGDLPACYTQNADGTETWTQINKELSDASFSAEAHTADAEPASRDLVLQVLSTLSFQPTE